jgi:hypothetical protein
VLSQRADVRIGRAARQDKKISHIGDTTEIEDHDVIRFVLEADLGCALRKNR